MRTHVSDTHILVIFEPEEGDEDIYDLIHPSMCEPQPLIFDEEDGREHADTHICAWSYALENENLRDYFVFPGDTTVADGRQNLVPGIYLAVMKINTERNYWGEVEEEIDITILPPETTHEV